MTYSYPTHFKQFLFHFLKSNSDVFQKSLNLNENISYLIVITKLIKIRMQMLLTLVTFLFLKIEFFLTLIQFLFVKTI